MRTTAKRFRFVAVAEALSWLGLLVGMGFKYAGPHNEVGVQIFGPIHGAVFVLFVAVAIGTAVRLRWGRWTTVLALLASIPPFGTLIFEQWAVRTGRLAELSSADESVALAS